MATVSKFVKYWPASTSTGSSSGTSSGSASTTTTPAIPEAGQYYETDRNMILDSINTINQTYDELIRSGKAADAFSLADAADRFARTGSEMGVNAFSRASAVTDLANKMNAASALTQNTQLASKLQANSSAIGQLVNLDEAAYNAKLKEYNAQWEQKQYGDQESWKERLYADQKAATTSQQDLTPTAPTFPTSTGSGGQAAMEAFRESAATSKPSTNVKWQRVEKLVPGYGTNLIKQYTNQYSYDNGQTYDTVGSFTGSKSKTKK